MEKKEQVVKMGVLRLLPGFRFHPTDQELVLDYLKRKAFSFPLPASIIPVVLNLSNSDPWDLPGDLEQERYFFSTRDIKYPSTSGGNYRSNRATSSGYWKATGLDKKILALGGRGNNQQQEEEVVGMKKTLVFYTRKPPHGSSSRTHWIMHEYRLTLPPQSQLQDQVHNWVLCRIFPKKRGIAKNRVDDDEMKKKNSPPVFMANNSSTKRRRRITDLNVPASTSSSSSSSASSGITEASDHGESSSCCCSNTNNE